MSKRIYLAGPDIFLSNPAEIYRAKEGICAEYGFMGISPLNDSADLDQMPRRKAGFYIAHENEAKMRSCDALIAHITPFRSPSADPGTAYEMGYMCALGRPVFAYTNVGGTFFERTSQHLGPAVRQRHGQASHEDADGLLLEDFDLVDNLMLEGAVHHHGVAVVVVEADEEKRFTELSGFTQCVQQARELFARQQTPQAS